jgi:hypothetical protein
VVGIVPTNSGTIANSTPAASMSLPFEFATATPDDVKPNRERTISQTVSLARVVPLDDTAQCHITNGTEPIKASSIYPFLTLSTGTLLLLGKAISLIPITCSR